MEKRLSHRKEFVKMFRSLCCSHSTWDVWRDVIFMIAAEFSQPFDFRETREETYKSTAKKYSKQELEIFIKMLAELVFAFEKDGFDDILGSIYMELELGNNQRGQFFTPYPVCRVMSEMTLENCAEKIERKGYISINDPAVGAGALLIAAAETMKNHGINYQQNALFVAQDVDPVAAQMALIQMSLLGMAGYVIVGNTLTADFSGYDYWYTPMYFHKAWVRRRAFEDFKALVANCGNSSETSREGVVSVGDDMPPATPPKNTKPSTKNCISLKKSG
jgi:hypothetical protein